MSELAVVSSLKDQVTPGLAGMLRTTRKWSTSMVGAVSGLARNFVSLRGAVVGVAAVWGARLFGSFVSSTAEAAAELAALSSSMGVTVQSLSEMQYALGSVGLKASDASDLFRTFGRSIASAAEGSDKQQAALQALGLDLEALKGGQIDLVALLGDVSEGLGRMGTQAEKTQALVALFGEKGQRLIPFLSQSREEIKAWSEEARRMGVSVDTGMVGISTAFVNAKMKFESAVTGVKNAILVEFYPALTEGLKKMAEFIAENRDQIVETVRSIAVGVVDTFEKLAKAFLGIAEQMASMMRWFGFETEGVKALRTEIAELKKVIAMASAGSPFIMVEELREEAEAAAKRIEELQAQIAKANAISFAEERAAIERAAAEIRSLLGKRRAQLEDEDYGPPFPEEDYKAKPPAVLPFEPGMAEDLEVPSMDRAKELGPPGEWDKFTAGMKEGVDDFRKYATDTTQIAKDTMGAALSWTTEIMTQGFSDMVTGAKSAGQAFAEMGKGMLQMLAQLIIKFAMLKLVSSIFGPSFLGGSEAPAGAGVGGTGFAPAMAAGGGIGAAGVGGAGTGLGFVPQGGPVNVSFTIHANDARGFRELLHRDRSMIEGLIQDAVSRRPVFRKAIGSA